MNNRFQLLGSVLMLLGVASGAFGAQWLKQIFSAESLVSFETAVRYLLIHGLAILILSSLKLKNSVPVQTILNVMFWGICLFSGSIFVIVLEKNADLGIPLNIVGPITPAGGSLLIFAWSWLIYTLWKYRESNDNQ